MGIKNFIVGQIYSNDNIVEYLGVNRQGGIRISRKNKIIILTNNCVKKKYDNIWKGDTLYYIGAGNQEIKRGNKTLKNAVEENLNIYLFEIYNNKEYTFLGEVYLINTPYYQETLNNKDNKIEKLLIFPLKKVINKNHKIEIKLIEKKNLQELEECLNIKTMSIHKRSTIIKEIALKKANGICQLCNLEGPFKKKDGKPYLEVHHIIPLAKKGKDHPNNVIALCPNCHRKMHYLNNKEDIKKLQSKLKG